MANAPRIGKFSSSAVVQWGDGSLFDGFLLVGFSRPTLAAAEMDVRLGNYGEPAEPLPQFYKIPIVAGAYSQNAGLFFNEDLNPRNTKYYAWLYTGREQAVAGPSASFAVTSEVITAPTFTVPTPAEGSAPTPDASGSTTTVPVSTYVLTGDVDADGFDITGIDALGAVTGTFTGAVSSVGITGTTAAFSGAITGDSLTATGNVNSTGVNLTGTTFKYFTCESDHLAFYKKSGSFHYFWRTSNDGSQTGGGGAEQMSLTDAGNLNVLGAINSQQTISATQGLRVTGGSCVGSSSTPYRTFCVAGPESDMTDSDSGGGLFSVGTGVGQTDAIITMGVRSTAIQYGWIQVVKAGTATYPLILNPRGSGVVVGAPTTAVPDATHSTNTVSFYLDEVNHRLYVKAKESNGVIKTGYIQLS